MSTCLLVRRTFEDSGDALGETHGYIVQFDDMLATAAQARTANDGTNYIPTEGTILGATLWRSKASAKKRPDEPTFFDVEVKYSLDVANESRPAEPASKWNLKWNASSQAYERPAYIDSGGNRILNSAGEPFTQQPVYVQYDIAHQISFNTDDAEYYDVLKAVCGHSNDDDCFISYKGKIIDWGTRHLRMVNFSWDIDHKRTSDGSDEVFSASLTLHERVLDEWYDVEVSNEGFHDIEGKVIPDAPGFQRGEPHLLNPSGYKLEDGDLAVPLRFTIQPPVSYVDLFRGLTD